MSYAYGLFLNEELVGVVTYGTPSSSTLRNGVAGVDYAKYVIELNRLCLLNNNKNEASILVSKSLRLLPKPSIVLSYADTEQGHVGYVYQATNFSYHGLSAKRTDMKVRGLEHLHSQTISDMVRGEQNRIDALRQMFGDRIYYAKRSRKHRYIYVCGSKSFKKKFYKDCKYKIENYPKGDKHETNNPTNQ